MNGMKLGTKQKQKNSFAFENQFLNYQSSKKSDEYDDEDDELYSQSRNAESRNLSSKNASNVVKNNKQEPIKIKSQNKLDVKVINNDSSATKKNQQKKVGVEQRISKINQNISKLNVNIHEMKDNYQDLQLKQKMLTKRNQVKQLQIKQFLSKKQQQKQILIQKKKRQQEKQRKKLEQQIKIQEQQKAKKSKNKIQQHLRRLGQMRQRREAQKQKAQQKNKIVSKLFQKISNQEKKFYLRKQEQDNIRKQEQLKRRRMVLKERKQKFKSIDFSQLQDHRRRHEQARNEIIQAKKIKRIQLIQNIQKQNEKFNQLYRGQSHDYIQDELQQKRLKSQAPKLKNNKIKQYQKLIKQNYLPKTHQPSQRKSQLKKSRKTQTHREFKRYRYLNGVSCGQIVQIKPLPITQKKMKQMGDKNLAYLYSLPKKKIQISEPSLSPQDLAILNNKLNSIKKVKREINPLYEKSSHHTVQIKISDKPTRDQVNMIFQQLRSKDEQTRMKQKLMKYQQNNAGDMSYKQKQINEEIVKNIQQKLNLLSKI